MDFSCLNEALTFKSYNKVTDICDTLMVHSIPFTENIGSRFSVSATGKNRNRRRKPAAAAVDGESPLNPAEEIAAGLDMATVVPEMTAGFVDLFPELRRAVIRVEFPSLSAHVVVGAEEVWPVLAFCNLRNLEGASERLAVFEADLDRPASFAAAIEGCVGVFHVAHPLDFEEREAEQVKIERVVNGAVGILQACLDAKTVKRVIYCSSTSAAIVINEETGGVDVIDESSWTDVEFVRSLGIFGGPYMVTKTLAEKSVLDFGEKHGLDVVAVLPTWIHGPFICPYLPDSVSIFMSFILGKKECYHQLGRTSVVHVDDVVRAHIHLFENPEAKGRYIISNVEITIEKLHEFLSAKYPEYKLPSTDEFADLKRVTIPSLSSRKLVESGFNFANGLQEMYDGAIKSCKQIGLL